MATPRSRRCRTPFARLILPLLLAAAAVSCTSSIPTVKLSGRPSGDLSTPISGVYKVTVSAPLVGPISARISASQLERTKDSAGGFIANSRPGVAWNIIGGLPGLLGRIFAPDLFPGGVIITWTSQNPGGNADKPGEGWIGIGGIKSARAQTRITSPSAPIDILAPDGRRVATMKLEPIAADGPPLDDYPALAAGAEAAIKERLFDPDLADSWQVRTYLSQLKQGAATAQDDIEFLFSAVLAARNNIKFSMPLLFRRADLGSGPYIGEADRGDAATLRATMDEDTGIATLKVDAFLDAGDVDRVMEQILEWDPDGLLIDMSAAPGVTLASLRTACWLLDHPTDAGFYFGPGRREGALAGRLDGFPRIELSSASSVQTLESALDGAAPGPESETSPAAAAAPGSPVLTGSPHGAACIIIIPEPRGYRGPVAVLTSKRTSTSAEPLAHLLQSTGRARLFGSPTAGRPTLSRPIPIGSDWVIWLAACDYLSPTGEPLSTRGVRPDVEGSRSQSREAARAWLEEQAALRAGG